MAGEDSHPLFRQPCAFVAGAATVDRIPEDTLPEVGFVGRSNVGKSSLLNALTGQNALARVSKTPGRTKQLNFFNLADTLMLVDMPGYGYAKVSKAERAVWDELIFTYLRGRPSLRRVYMLIDSRHGLKDSDRFVLDLLDKAAVNTCIVLTKVDKQSGKGLEKVTADVQLELKKHPAAFPNALMTSSEKWLGIKELQEDILSLT